MYNRVSGAVQEEGYGGIKMSSNTQYHVRPRPIPQPTVYKVQGEEAIAVDQVLGTGGTKLLRETLAALPALRQTLGQGVAKQLDWEPVRGEDDCYETKVDGVSVVLQLGGALARVSHTHEESIVGSAVRPTLQPTVRKAVHRKVNQLLAVAMAQRVSEKIKQYVKTSVKQEVRLSVTNNFTLRASAYFKAR